jgi:hypothetical protein
MGDLVSSFGETAPNNRNPSPDRVDHFRLLAIGQVGPAISITLVAH